MARNHAKVNTVSDRGSFDMPSTVVATAVTLIMLSVVSVIVFFVIPWQQNKSAQTFLITVDSAQESIRTLSGQYLDKDGLERRGILSDRVDNGDLQLTIVALSSEYTPAQGLLETGQTSGNHYVAFMESESGAFYYMSSKLESPERLHVP